MFGDYPFSIRASKVNWIYGLQFFVCFFVYIQYLSQSDHHVWSKKLVFRWLLKWTHQQETISTQISICVEGGQVPFLEGSRCRYLKSKTLHTATYQPRSLYRTWWHFNYVLSLRVFEATVSLSDCFFWVISPLPQWEPQVIPLLTSALVTHYLAGWVSECAHVSNNNSYEGALVSVASVNYVLSWVQVLLQKNLFSAHLFYKNGSHALCGQACPLPKRDK